MPLNGRGPTSRNENAAGDDSVPASSDDQHELPDRPAAPNCLLNRSRPPLTVRPREGWTPTSIREQGGHSPRGSHSSRPAGRPTCDMKLASRATFSAVGRKRFGQCSSTAVACRMWAHSRVLCQPASTAGVVRKDPSAGDCSWAGRCAARRRRGIDARRRTGRPSNRTALRERPWAYVSHVG